MQPPAAISPNISKPSEKSEAKENDEEIQNKFSQTFQTTVAPLLAPIMAKINCIESSSANSQIKISSILSLISSDVNGKLALGKMDKLRNSSKIF